MEKNIKAILYSDFPRMEWLTRDEFNARQGKFNSQLTTRELE